MTLEAQAARERRPAGGTGRGRKTVRYDQSGMAVLTRPGDGLVSDPTGQDNRTTAAITRRPSVGVVNTGVALAVRRRRARGTVRAVGRDILVEVVVLEHRPTRRHRHRRRRTTSVRRLRFGTPGHVGKMSKPKPRPPQPGEGRHQKPCFLPSARLDRHSMRCRRTPGGSAGNRRSVPDDAAA